MNHSDHDHHLVIGAIVFPRMDQFDLTGPFEVLSRLPNSTFHILWKEKLPIRDARGLILTPEVAFSEAPPLDILVIPGGPGQVDLMEDEVTLSFIRKQVAGAKLIFSVCTGTLTVAAAGLLNGIRGTTHWASFEVLEHLGVIPVNQRVVIDGKFVSAAGVSSGIDGALRVAALLRGELVAQEIQLYMQYAPEPPFHSGTPDTAPAEVLAAARRASGGVTETRIAAAKRVAAKFS